MESQLIAHPEESQLIKADIQNRILSLSSEKKNEELCDRVVVNNGTLLEAVKEFY